MEIEVGEYVRYKDGTISKVLDINKDETFDLLCENFTLSSKFVVKYSKNIIDLIELYDNVNGFLVFDIIAYEDGTRKIKLTNGTLLQNKDIENILTHEQYEANCYEVKED